MRWRQKDAHHQLTCASASAAKINWQTDVSRQNNSDRSEYIIGYNNKDYASRQCIVSFRIAASNQYLPQLHRQRSVHSVESLDTIEPRRTSPFNAHNRARITAHACMGLCWISRTSAVLIGSTFYFFVSFLFLGAVYIIIFYTFFSLFALLLVTI